MIDIAVIGGGLAGSVLVRRLLERGHPAERIALIDAARPTRASNVPAALMHPFPGRSMRPREGQLTSARASIELLRALADEMSGEGIVELPMIRPLVGELGEKLLDSWRQSADDYPHWFDSRLVPGEALAERQPAIAPFERALVYEPAFSVDTRAVAAHLRAEFDGAGVALFESTHIERIVHRTTSWRLESDDGDTLAARRVVLANGWGLRRWFPDLAIRGRGGEVLVAPPPEGAKLTAIVNASGHVAPRADGAWVAGSTYWDPDEFSARTDEQARRDLVERCARLTPALAEADPDACTIWRGVRTMYRGDNRPLVGPVAGLERVFAFGGFGSKGLLRIPHLAERFAASLLDDEPIPERASTARVEPGKWRPRSAHIGG